MKPPRKKKRVEIKEKTPIKVKFIEAGNVTLKEKSTSKGKFTSRKKAHPPRKADATGSELAVRGKDTVGGTGSKADPGAGTLASTHDENGALPTSASCVHARVGTWTNATILTKKPMRKDMIRLKRFTDLLKEGVEELDAYWATITDPTIGFGVYRDVENPHRPADVQLSGSLRALIKRTVPEFVEQARLDALAELSALRPNATKAVSETVDGEFNSTKGASAKQRLRLDAAKLILDGVGATGGKNNVNVAVNQQNMNVGISAVLDLMDARGWPKGL